MARHEHGHRHLQKKQPKDWLDWLLYAFMVATPLFEVPQAWKIYATQSANDVSLTTWGFFVVSNTAWISYAIRNRLLPLIVVYSLFMLVEGAIVVGIILYS